MSKVHHNNFIAAVKRILKSERIRKKKEEIGKKILKLADWLSINRM